MSESTPVAENEIIDKVGTPVIEESETTYRGPHKHYDENNNLIIGFQDRVKNVVQRDVEPKPILESKLTFGEKLAALKKRFMTNTQREKQVSREEYEREQFEKNLVEEEHPTR